MTIRVKKIFTAFLILITIFPCLVSASEETRDSFLALVNQVRLSPADTILSMGVDPALVGFDIPASLPLAAARDLMPDFAGHHIYKGRIDFFNYMDAATAVGIFFENMVRDELAGEAGPMIFNPDYRYLDLDLDFGWDGATGVSYYEIRCVFASESAAAMEEMIVLINQARMDPLSAAEMAGFELPEQPLDEISTLLAKAVETDFDPLVLSPALSVSAGNHAHAMLEAGNLSAIAPDGSTPVQRAEGNGYLGGVVLERNGLALFCSCVDVSGAIRQIFSTLLKREMAGLSDPLILNPGFRDIGIGLAMGHSKSLGSICGDYVLVVCLDFGRVVWDIE